MGLPEFGILAAAIAALAGAIAYLAKARSDWKTGTGEEFEQLLSLKDEMIAALREANDDLRKREAEMHEEVVDLKRRLSAVEGQYRTLVKTVVESGICALAPGCVNYVAPGDRRGDSQD